MKIQIPKVVLPVSLAEYAPELDGKFLFVWVNPPREKLKAYDELVTSLQEREVTKARATLGDEQSAEGSRQTPLQRTFDQVLRMLHVKRETPDEGVDAKLLEWYAEIWSQGNNVETHWTAEELRELEAQDPSFLSWMIAKTWQTRSEHVERKKKVLATL